MGDPTHDRTLTMEHTRGRPGTARLAGLFLGAATLGVGLVAGFFFDWAVAIMPSLAQTDDRTFVDVMLKMITTIETSAPFLLAFNGGLVGAGVAAILLHRAGARAAMRWTLAALGIYLAAIFVTFGVHFPLHDTLEAAGDPATMADIAGVRDDFEGPWVNAHLVRTIAAVAAFTCLCRALWVRRGGSPVPDAR